MLIIPSQQIQVLHILGHCSDNVAYLTYLCPPQQPTPHLEVSIISASEGEEQGSFAHQSTQLSNHSFGALEDKTHSITFTNQNTPIQDNNNRLTYFFVAGWLIQQRLRVSEAPL